MSRILLTWELGLNLGHLARLLPLAQQLKARGHRVLVASRDLQAAAQVLGPAGIPYVQAPHLSQGLPLAHRPSGYADILLCQGWSSRSALHGLTHAWLNLLRLFNPEGMILDYSPTASLAARIAQIPTVLIGNGFELPPSTDPLPCFPGFSWANPGRAATSEALALTHANGVLSAFGGTPAAALRDLTAGRGRFLVTFQELDHYGDRADETYIGPLFAEIRAHRIDWPVGSGPKIFACLRPDTSHVQQILTALAATEARVVCVAAGFTAAQLEPFKSDSIHFCPGPVDLQHLGDADLCVTYGAEGTLLKLLLAGVPQLISPWHVETCMAARRVEALQVGRTLKEPQVAEGLAGHLIQLCADSELKANATAFAQRHAQYTCEQAVAAICRTIDATGQPDGCLRPAALAHAPSKPETAVAPMGSLS